MLDTPFMITMHIMALQLLVMPLYAL